MIFLRVEIKEDKFIFEYEVGDSRQSSTTNINPRFLASFTDILRLCAESVEFSYKERERKILYEAVARETVKGATNDLPR